LNVTSQVDFSPLTTSDHVSLRSSLFLPGNLASDRGLAHVEPMRRFGLLASLILLAALAACAEAAGPSYAYAPGYEYGPWPEGYYCCEPSLVRLKHHHDHHHHHHGHGGHHH
jgi:hypothetical protein